jgi:hypothetical protein
MKRIVYASLSSIFIVIPWLLLAEVSVAQSDSFLQSLSTFLGFPAVPEPKAPRDDLAAGSVWMADLTAKTTRRLNGENCRSPIFLRNGDVLALKGEMIVRIPLDGGTPSPIHAVAGIDKLVAASNRDPDDVLVLLTDSNGRPTPAIVSLPGGAIFPVPVDFDSEDDIRGLAHLQGWDRDYGDIKLRVERVRKAALSGIREWTDVFLMREGQEAVNLTNCDDVGCGQPSLSPDRRRVVFIKGEIG